MPFHNFNESEIAEINPKIKSKENSRITFKHLILFSLAYIGFTFLLASILGAYGLLKYFNHSQTLVLYIKVVSVIKFLLPNFIIPVLLAFLCLYLVVRISIYKRTI
jgi:uncharacterized paraquat-inducible protein A